MRVRRCVPAFVATVAIALCVQALRAQVADKGCSGTVANPNCSDGSRSGRIRTVAPPPVRPGAVSDMRRRDAVELNNQAIDAWRDWDRLDEVRQLLERAVALDPSDAIIAGNLRDVRADISMMRSRAQATTLHVDAAIARLAGSLGRGDGLDFSATAVTPGSSLQFGATSLVDARAVASGLPAGVDSAIAGAYGSAPAGVADRVRKGFQAVMVHDWKVARAWFADALNRDPQNAGLKKLIASVEQSARPVRPSPAPPTATADVLAPLLGLIDQLLIEEFDDLLRGPR